MATEELPILGTKILGQLHARTVQLLLHNTLGKNNKATVLHNTL